MEAGCNTFPSHFADKIADIHHDLKISSHVPMVSLMLGLWHSFQSVETENVDMIL